MAMPSFNDNDCGEKCYRFIIFFTSFIITLAGLGTIVGAFYLLSKASFNMLILFFLLVGLLILVVTPILTLTMKRRPCVILVFIIYMFIITAAFIVVGFIVLVADGWIDDLAEEMEDSKKTFEEIKKALKNMKMPIGLMFIVASLMGIIDTIALMLYRCKEENVLFDKASPFEDDDELLKSISKGSSKKERLYDGDSLETPDLY